MAIVDGLVNVLKLFKPVSLVIIVLILLSSFSIPVAALSEYENLQNENSHDGFENSSLQQDSDMGENETPPSQESTHAGALVRKGWNFEEYATSPGRKMIIYASARYFLDNNGWKSHALSENSTSYVIKVPYDNTGKPASLVVNKITGEIKAHDPDNDLLMLQNLVVNNGEDELQMADLSWGIPYENATGLYLMLNADLMLTRAEVATIEMTFRISGLTVKPEIKLTAEVADNYSIAWFMRSPAEQLRIGSTVENFATEKVWAKENIIPFGTLNSGNGGPIVGFDFTDICPLSFDDLRHDLSKLKEFKTYKDATGLSTVAITFGDFDLSAGQALVLDPSFCSTSSDGFIRSDSSTYTGVHDAPADSAGMIPCASLTDAFVGQAGGGFGIRYYIWRAYLFFSTSSIPDDAIIESASLRLYGKYDWSDTDFSLVIQNGQPTYPHDPFVLGDFYYAHYSGTGGSYHTSGFAIGGYNDIAMTDEGKGWINKTGTTKFCIRSSRDIGSVPPTSPTYTEEVGFHTSEAGLGYQPMLVVAYTVPVGADLVVDSISYTINQPPLTSSEVRPTVDFTIKMKNQGDRGTGGFEINYYINGAYVGSDPVSSLPAGLISTETFLYTFSSEGTYEFTAKVDEAGAVAETNKTNNDKTTPPFTVNFIFPDLEMTNVSYLIEQPPRDTAEIYPGDVVNFTVDLWNKGQRITPGFYLDFYVSGSRKNRGYISSLSGGSTEDYTFKYRFTESGSYNIKAVADATGAVWERDEGNNEGAIDLSAKSIIAPYVQSSSVEPEGPVEMGTTYMVSINVKNPNYVSLYVTIDATEEILPIDSLTIDPTKFLVVTEDMSRGEVINAQSDATFSFSYSHSWRWLGPLEGKPIHDALDWVLAYAPTWALPFRYSYAADIATNVYNEWKISQMTGQSLPMVRYGYTFSSIPHIVISEQEKNVTITTKKLEDFRTAIEQERSGGGHIGWGGAAKAIAVTDPEPFTKVLFAIFGVGAEIFGGYEKFISSEDYLRSSFNPDLDYEITVEPQLITVPELERLPAGPVREMLYRYSVMAANLRALQAAYGKYESAKQAGSTEWMLIHLSAARNYANLVLEDLTILENLAPALLEQYRELQETEVFTTEGEIQAIKDQIREEGLSIETREFFQSLGFTEDDLASITDLALSIPNSSLVKDGKFDFTIDEAEAEIIKNHIEERGFLEFDKNIFRGLGYNEDEIEGMAKLVKHVPIEYIMNFEQIILDGVESSKVYVEWLAEKVQDPTLLPPEVEEIPAPTVSVIHSPERPTYEQFVTFIVTSADELGVTQTKLYIDGVEVATWSGGGTFTYVAGPYSPRTHTYSAMAVNSLGYMGGDPAVGIKSFEVIDLTPPLAPELVSPEDGLTINDNTPMFDWSYVTDPSGVIYELQVDDDFDFSSPALRKSPRLVSAYQVWPTEALTDCIYYWRVRATDGAGNVGDWSSTWMLIVDTTPPAAPALISPENGAKTDNTPTFEWSPVEDPSGVIYTLQYSTDPSFPAAPAQPPAAITLTVKNLVNNTYTVPEKESLPDGTWYWRVRAVDGAGNVGSWSQTWSFEVVADSTPPVSFVDPIEPYWRNELPFTITAQASDDRSGVESVALWYRYSSNNATWDEWLEFGMDEEEPYEWMFDAPEGDGYYEFYTIAVDRAGNVEAAPESADARAGVDTTPPESSVDPIEPYWQNADMVPFEVTATATDPIPPSGALPSGLKQVELYYRHSLDNSTWGAWTSYGVDDVAPYSWSFEALEGDGYYEFYSMAVDVALNVEEAPEVVDTTCGIDTILPISSVNPIHPYWQNAEMVPFEITATATDPIPPNGALPSGLKQVELYYRYSPGDLTWGAWASYSVDAGGADGWSWVFDSPHGDGYYEFYTATTDIALNVEDASEEADARAGVDTVPPVSSVDPLEYWQLTTTFRITATVLDPIPPSGAVPSGIKGVGLLYRYSDDNENWSEWAPWGVDGEAPYEWTFTSPNIYGYYEFYSVATDVALNVEDVPDKADVAVCVVIPATIDIDPDTLNLKSEGKWVTAYIELPTRYHPSKIVLNTVSIEGNTLMVGVVLAEADPKYGFVKSPEIVDRDGDGLPEFMVKFDRAAVQGLVEVDESVEVVVIGYWNQIPFRGSDNVRVIEPGRIPQSHGNKPEVPPGQSGGHPSQGQGHGNRPEVPPSQSGEAPGQGGNQGQGQGPPQTPPRQCGQPPGQGNQGGQGPPQTPPGHGGQPPGQSNRGEAGKGKGRQ